MIQHDVQRLDRLISDISDASRLDAELQRQEAAPVDLHKAAHRRGRIANEVRARRAASASRCPSKAAAPSRFHRARATIPASAQVIDNLIDNARSFSSPGGTVRITCRRLKNDIEIVVDDDGPGIRADAFEKIFERFYTDRPHQGFGQNSGLGLSISKQIVEAHGGRIWAENRHGVPTHDGAEPLVLGARFIVRLPAM